mgnify:CR=1 FL=1
MSRTKRNYLWQIALLTLVGGSLGGWGYFSLCPHHYFNGYPLIPAYFFLLGVGMINLVEWGRRTMPNRLLQIYMLVRTIRMLVSFILMLVYCVVVRTEAVAFALTFIAFYLIYLIYDSWFFCTFEGSQKMKKMKKQHETNV